MRAIIIPILLFSLNCYCQFNSGLRNLLYNVEFDDGLFAWYTYNQDNAIDTISAYNGLEVNTPTYTSGKIGNSILFNGSNQAVEIDEILTLMESDTEGSFTFWFKPDDVVPTSFQVFFGFGKSNESRFIHIGLPIGGDAGKLISECRSDVPVDWSVQTDNVVLNNKWIHVALIQDGVEPAIYINGVEQSVTFNSQNDKTSWVSAFSGSLNTATFGALDYNNSGNAFHYDGGIDEFKIWRTNLSSEKIDTLYREPLPNAFNMVGWWQMNNNSDDYTETSDAIATNITYTTDKGSATNSAARFNGTNACWDLDSNYQTDFRASFAFSLFIAPDEGKEAVGQFVGGVKSGDNTDEIWVAIDADGKLEFKYDVNSTSNVTKTTDEVFVSGDNDFIHCLGVFDEDSTKIQIYVDGVKQSTTYTGTALSGITFADYTNVYNMNFGCFNIGGVKSQFFDGDLDDIKLYNVVDFDENDATILTNDYR